MAGTNDFLPFSATDTGTNLETQVAYAADPNRLIGNQPGVALSKFVNKALRQSNYITSCLAQFISNFGPNMIDPVGNITGGTTAVVIAAMQTAFKTPPTNSKFLSGSGAYNPPANVAYIRVRMVGGGQGGGGTASNGGAGGNSTLTANFGPALLVAGGAASLSGGTASLGAGPIGIATPGGSGTFPSLVAAGSQISGGNGASSPFGGAGAGGSFAGAGLAAAANTGSGGGGATSPAGGGSSGAGGAAGGYIDCIITPAMACWVLPFAYVVGVAGAAGAGGAALGGGAAGGGLILIDEFYQ